MKLYTYIIAISAVLIFFSCKSGEKLTKQQVIDQTTEKVESTDYTFNAKTALPMAGRTINLNYPYSLKISKDTIIAYLPYYGRAYSAPYPSDDGGIKFTSTDFDYTLSDKKKGMWHASVIIKDDRKNYRLNLEIGDTGNATLTVQDNTRQTISFYGKID